MATVPENLGYVTGIYQLETTDPLEGGPGGKLNQATSDLASRTAWLRANRYAQFQVIELDCDAAYITANFNGTGLGLSDGLWPGFAICNGNNGTKNRIGRVGIGFGGVYTMGTAGGNKDAVVVSHNHTINPNIIRKDGATGGEVINYGNDVRIRTVAVTGETATSTTGESGTDKNMQPYIVSLFIMKL